ncbi:MAG TPA: transglutaminaseTgpA domain-containing protein [Gaiellaceae bacterium]|nr:transglutaminaseTgpA domain-containing protein [Gaiellaceae bacterium]
MARTLAASLLPALVVAWAWLGLESPARVRDALAVATLALVPVLLRSGVARALGAVAAAGGAAWIAFGAQPWELLPWRDERVVAPLARDLAQGVADFYGVYLPFEPGSNPEMHSLVLAAIFGFVLAIGQLVAARRPLGAAAVTVAGVGWPATLLGTRAIAFGVLALVAALSIPLVLRASSARSILAGGFVAALVVAGATLTSSATTLARESALDWETWDIGGPRRDASDIRFVWDSNYDGISFPPEETVVMRVQGPRTPYYWRTTTLDLFSDDHWFEHLFWLDQVDHADRNLQRPQLVPERSQVPRNWLDQRVEVEALVDDHLAAAGTPVALDAAGLGTVFLLSGGVLRAREAVSAGEGYRVWSYAPDPSPRALARAATTYPNALSRFLEVDGRFFPHYGEPGREAVVRAFFEDPAYSDFQRHLPMYRVAQRVAGNARTPYGAVLAIESWLRQTGGFRYDESPPRGKGPPLVSFVTRTKSGYCQHFAGAMAAMLRMLGVPARVAVGFTSGTLEDDEWVVTDHDAHAWVEVWFSGVGWVAFDPTPGRGTLGGEYSFASGSQDAVARLRRGDLTGSARPTTPSRTPDTSDLGEATGSAERSPAPSIVAVGLVVGAAWIVLLGLGKAAFRRARYLSRDPRRLATASRRELEDFMRDQGVDVPVNATLEVLRKTLHDEFALDGRAFARAAASGRFGPPGILERNAANARREVRRLLEAARSELSLWARFRGLVSLRSLRAGS